MWWSTDGRKVACRLLKPASQVQLLPVTLWTTTKVISRLLISQKSNCRRRPPN